MKNYMLLIMLIANSCALLAQQPETVKKENFRIRLHEVQNGKTVEIDTTFSSRTEMDAFMKARSISQTSGTKPSENQVKVVNKIVKKEVIDGMETVTETIDSNVYETDRPDTLKMVMEDIMEIQDSFPGGIRSIREVEIRVQVRMEDLNAAEESLLYPKKVPAELDVTTFQISPNPANQKVHVQFQTAGTTAVLRVLNPVGRMLLEQDLRSNSGRFETDLDLQQLSAGIYFVQIVQQEKYYTKKLILE